jgi:hypothetical protein
MTIEGVELCDVDECDRPAFARRWCLMHYKWWYKTDPPVRFPRLVIDAAYHRARRAANPEAANARSRRSYAAHREQRTATARARYAIIQAQETARHRVWVAANRDAARRIVHRRKATKAGVPFIIRVATDECGVCLRPIDRSLVFPHPMSLSVGHEPPLSVARAEGWSVVCERSEHLSCNVQKGARLDIDAAFAASFRGVAL